MESQTRNTQLAIWEWTLQFLLCLLFLIPLISGRSSSDRRHREKP